MKEHHPRVGIGIMVFKENRILLGKRINAHGENTFSFAGGHLGHMESFEDCAKREVFEECGIKINNIQFISVANIKTFTPKHYVNINYKADWAEGIPTVKEPNKCTGWDWYAMDQLPNPLFEPAALMIHHYKNQTIYVDAPAEYQYDQAIL